MGALDYLIQFQYECKYGISQSTCYASSPSEVDDKIKKHIDDDSEPRMIGYRVYMLVKEEETRSEVNNDKI